MPKFGLLVSLMMLSSIVTLHAAEPRYVANQQCLSCHQEAAKQWRQSDHYFSMLPATPENVLGAFDNRTLNHNGHTLRFFKSKEGYFISITKPEAPEETFKVTYTFGYNPLQQYLLEFPDGKYQVFYMAWDTKRKRWYSLAKEDELSEPSPLHWRKRFYNWNTSCADCHSTQYSKQYDGKRYRSTFAGVNVNCQACHGPGSAHVAWA